MPDNPSDTAHRANPGFQVGHHSFTPAPRPRSPIERMIDKACGVPEGFMPVAPPKPTPPPDGYTEAFINVVDAAVKWSRRYKSEAHRKRAEEKLRLAVKAYRKLGGW